MEFDQAVAELDTLVQTLERDGDERALMLLQLMDAVHRPALERIVAGDVEHPVARAVLSMYDLAPLEELVQADEALDAVRPYIESHGGGLDLLEVEPEAGIVHVRMRGSCHGCAASAMTLRRGVEAALREHLDWFTEVVAHDEEAADGDTGAPPGDGIAARLLQIEQYNGDLRVDAQVPAPPAGVPGDIEADVGGRSEVLQIEGLERLQRAPRPVFVNVGSLADLAPGTMKAADVDGHSILVVNLEGEPYAFRNVCPVDGRSELDGGRLTGSVIVCGWHNCAYDARSGKRVDDEAEAEGLAVVPIALRDGQLQVAASFA